MYYWVKLKCDVLRPDLLAYIIKTKKCVLMKKLCKPFHNTCLYLYGR